MNTNNDWTVEKLTLYFHLQTLFVNSLSNNQEDYDKKYIPSFSHTSILTSFIWHSRLISNIFVQTLQNWSRRFTN